ncbi:MAG TPA: hypothetical protein VGI39_36670 [Polyangiaceae bacterium]|jgi:hypothetical protein
MTMPLRPLLLAILAGSSLAACTSVLGDFSLADTSADGGAPDATPGADGGDDASHGPDGSGGGAEGGGGSSEGGGGGSEAGGSDACSGGACVDVVCPGSETACGGTCVDLASSSSNCGGCGHDCGGPQSQCTNSVCQPQTLLGNIDAPTAFAIDPASIYFAVDNVLKTCPLAGCVKGGTQLASYSALGAITVVGTTLTFAGTANIGNHPVSNLYTCSLPGCASPVSIQGAGIAGGFVQSLAVGADLYFLWEASLGAQQTSTIDQCVGVSGTGCQKLVTIIGDQAPPIAADPQNVYFSSLLADAGFEPGGIAACPGGAACSTPKKLINTTGLALSPTLMVAYGGVVYFVAERDLGTGGTLYSCPVTGCTEAASLDTADLGITSLAVDASGIYFTGTQGSNQGVFTCPLAGCGSGGAQAVVSQQPSPNFVATDANFIYWVNRGPADAGATAAILRVAK